MHIAVEMSLYPLADGYIPPIKDFTDPWGPGPLTLAQAHGGIK